MSSNLYLESLEEQDIGLYYRFCRSSLTISDTDLSSEPTSHPTSQMHLDSLPREPANVSLKSSSLSQVTTRLGNRPATHEPQLRSKTVPHLPLTVSGNGEMVNVIPSFEFSEEKLQSMRKWVLSFVVVQFDLDVGPIVRAVHPQIYLSPSERENIAFSSFPDSLQFEQGFELHSFRIGTYPKPSEDHVEKEGHLRSLDGFMYGFVHFCQKRDPTSKRGYQQSSLVLLTLHQYPALYTSMISQLGPLFHQHGVAMLETACHNIANWQTPVPGSTVELGFLGSVLHVELPVDSDSQQLAETSAFGERFNPAAHLLASSAPLNPPPIRLFEASLAHLWSLWECLVLGEPILVFGPSPSMTSQASWWLRDLVRPIPLAADIRPYFTIHDRDHASLINKAPPKAGLLIGVTNPFFEKACSHWPHLLSVGQKTSSRVVGPPPGWTTKAHRRYISKDRQLLRYLEKACSGCEAEQIRASLDMRRHFSTRTNAVLVPLNRYMNTLIPSPSERSAGKARLGSFSPSDFFASLKNSPPALPFKSTSKQKEFYDRWLRSPAFGLWLARQEEVIGTALRDLR